jgi:hypothetical protein
MTTRNVPTQQRVDFELTIQELGKVKVKVFDRITVDDVVLHLTNQRIYEVVSGRDPGYTVSENAKDFLVKERLRLG